MILLVSLTADFIVHAGPQYMCKPILAGTQFAQQSNSLLNSSAACIQCSFLCMFAFPLLLLSMLYIGNLFKK